jgi:hypothetical protein
MRKDVVLGLAVFMCAAAPWGVDACLVGETPVLHVRHQGTFDENSAVLH